MKFVICAVRDRAVDQFNTPFFVAALGQAVRSFSDEVNRVAEGNQMNMHPEDFDLYTLGSYESDDGSFVTDKPRMVAVGKDHARMADRAAAKDVRKAFKGE